MKPFKAILFLVFLTKALCSQHNAYFFKSDWENVKLEKDYIPTRDDTCITFASVRTCSESEKNFMGYDCDKNVNIKYFNIYFNGDKWRAVPKKSLQECLNGEDSLHAVTFVEGFGRTFLTALDRATLFSRQYGYHIIMFDWPTYRPAMKSGKNYKLTLKESETLAPYFSQFLSELNALKNNQPQTFKTLSLLMHSMGNLLMMHAVKGNQITVKDTLFNSIIMNSSCVPQKKHRVWVEKISIQQHLYITRNNRDRTLNGAKIISGFKRQLGERPRKPYAKNALYLNFSRVLDREHNYFLYPSVLKRKPYIKELYRVLLIGKEPDFNDENRYIKKPKRHAIDLFDLEEAQKGGISLGVGM